MDVWLRILFWITFKFLKAFWSCRNWLSCSTLETSDVIWNSSSSMTTTLPDGESSNKTFFTMAVESLELTWEESSSIVFENFPTNVPRVSSQWAPSKHSTIKQLKFNTQGRRDMRLYAIINNNTITNGSETSENFLFKKPINHAFNRIQTGISN